MAKVSVTLPISDRSHVGQARRRVEESARALGFNEILRGKLALVVTELAGNIVKYAGTGEIVYREVDDDRGDKCGLEILALDRGPGMADVGACLRDGYSTSGSPGTGLGGVMRLSTLFDLHSQPAVGTAVLAQLCEAASVCPAAGALGAVCVPKPGQEVCGDAWAAHRGSRQAAVLVADGLGHGLLAGEAAMEAVRVFANRAGEPSPAQFLALAHDALRKTRGAAIAHARIDFAQGHVDYAGVGNVAGTIVGIDGLTRSMVSHNGTAGAEVRKIQEFGYPLPRGGSVIMHTDGLARHWRLDKYPGLAAKHAGVIAGVLYRDFRRGNDDVTVVVAKWREKH